MHIPLALVNARLSEKSVQGWRRWPETSKMVISVFSVLLAQNRQAADNLVAIGGDPARVRVGVNLKSTSDPLPVDTALRDRMKAELGDRPFWVASSTHPNEENIVLEAHKALLATHSDLCLILVPRHPERGAEVAALLAQQQFTAAQRSAGAPITGDTEVYLADTLGETGTWYAAASIVFLGGSLFPIGGHNPFEPAQAGAAVLTGPHVDNFSETFDPMLARGAARTVQSAAELAEAVDEYLRVPGSLAAARRAAAQFTGERENDLDAVISTLCTKLDLN